LEEDGEILMHISPRCHDNHIGIFSSLSNTASMKQSYAYVQESMLSDRRTTLNQ